jgi:hypothetical protein
VGEKLTVMEAGFRRASLFFSDESPPDQHARGVGGGGAAASRIRR